MFNQARDLYKQFETMRYGPTHNNIEIRNQIIELGERLLKIASENDIGFSPAGLVGEFLVVYIERAHEMEERKDFKQAIDDYTRIIELWSVAHPPDQLFGKPAEPADLELYQRRCRCYLERRLLPEALNDASHLVELSGDSKAYLLRARCYYAMNYYDQAKADAALAWSLNKNSSINDAFDLYRKICIDLATKHDQALAEMLERYRQGERDFTNIDLSWTRLNGTDLSGINLSGAILENCIWHGCNFSNSRLRDTIMRNSRMGTFPYLYDSTRSLFDEADLQGANLQGATLYNTSFRGANLGQTNLREAYLGRADFSGANLQGAILQKASLHDAYASGLELAGVNLSEASLANADFRKANLEHAQLSAANLFQTCFISANLTGANLSRANFDETDLTDAILVQADLSGAEMVQAHFDRANLEGAVFKKASLTNVYLDDANIQNVDFSEADEFFGVSGIPRRIEKEWRKRNEKRHKASRRQVFW